MTADQIIEEARKMAERLEARKHRPYAGGPDIGRDIATLARLIEALALKQPAV